MSEALDAYPARLGPGGFNNYKVRERSWSKFPDLGDPHADVFKALEDVLYQSALLISNVISFIPNFPP